MNEEWFTYRSARSGSLVAGLGLALLVETAVLHLWLAARHPALAWVLTVASLGTLVWLATDYRAMGTGVIRLDDHSLALVVGRRFNMLVARENVAAVIQPGWRGVPEAGTPAAAEYANLTKPATPNVLITLGEPAQLRLPGGLRRRVRRIGLHVDEPQRLVSALSS